VFRVVRVVRADHQNPTAAGRRRAAVDKRGTIIPVILGVGLFSQHPKQILDLGALLRTLTRIARLFCHLTGSTAHVLVALMAANVGLDPAKDIRWVTDPSVKPIEQFVEGKIDAFMGFPPQPQDLRARQIGHVIVNSTVDRPWSQYFCCMAAGNRDYVQKHPVATKRALRAILKATDLCASEPTRVARRIVDGGFTPRYDYALQTFNEVPYDRWRDYDAADTIRFYALRIHETGFIKSSPQKIIAEGTEWRFLNELKRELKA
jgi:NitT/TauT family transport system substrate-binding protein